MSEALEFDYTPFLKLFKQRAQLADALRRCPCMLDRARRDAVYAELSPNIKAKILKRNDANSDILSFLNACIEEPDGIHELLSIVAYLEGQDSTSWQVVEATLREIISPRGIPKHNLNVLLAFLPTDVATADDIKSLVRETIPTDVDSFEALSDASAVIRLLTTFEPRLTGIPWPAVEFIERLAHFVNDQILKGRLRAWVDKLGWGFRDPPSGTRGLPQESFAAPKENRVG